MNKQIIYLIIVIIISASLVYFFQTDNSIPITEFCVNIENRFYEVKNINFSYYKNIQSGYSYYQDSFFVRIRYNIFHKIEIRDYSKIRYYRLDELPSNFIDNFNKIKRICDGLDVYQISKDSINEKTEFIFNIKYIRTETIPNWDKKLDNKKDEYDGILIYDVNNIHEKDNNYYKLKDKWYFEYHERRPN